MLTKELSSFPASRKRGAEDCHIGRIGQRHALLTAPLRARNGPSKRCKIIFVPLELVWRGNFVSGASDLRIQSGSESFPSMSAAATISLMLSARQATGSLGEILLHPD
jgi:hypothetical protein